MYFSKSVAELVVLFGKVESVGILILRVGYGCQAAILGLYWGDIPGQKSHTI